MRNIRNVRFSRWRHPDITSACWDPERDELLCTIGPTPQSSSVELVRISGDEHSSHQTLATWDAPSPTPEMLADKVVSSKYLSGTGTTCLVFEGGDIVTIQEAPAAGNGAHIEIMGSIDAGISAAKWSPDEELLVIVTKNNSLIFMGSTFDPLAEVVMTDADLKASKHVSVGWGKKETQFEGRGAKALRDPTIPLKTDEGVLSSRDDGATTVSWRGDGAFVAVNAIEGQRRVIRVYCREGELDSASEPVDGLEASLSWRPAGNLIAGVQRHTDSDRVDVVFFERNGLRHGEFTLRFPGGPLPSQQDIRLEWNADSTVLAVVLTDMIQLWTMGNYHWYLKKEIPIDHDSLHLAWHPEKALLFAAVSSSSAILSEEIFHIARGSCRPPHDNGAMAVIDGEKVKITPFRSANVPPPMSLFEISADSAVIDVAFGPQQRNFAVLHRQGVDIFEWPSKNGKPSRPQLSCKWTFDTIQTLEYQTALRICCSSDGNFRCLMYQGDTGHFQVRVPAEDAESGLSILDNHHELLASTTTYDDGSTIEGYGQDNTGRLYHMAETGNEPLSIQFPLQLPWFEITKNEGTVIAFGLSRNGHIYANSNMLAKNCTSFVLASSHLIFTTSNHLVKFVHLAADADELEIPTDDPEKDERCRSVERGSRLITAIPTNMSIILQMPRGNLETVFPRAMVVAGIRSLIDEKNYERAFSHCRTQRVDMNILYDHQPAQFVANVGLFLDQLKKVTYIDLFLSSLREEDVTQTMYQDTKRPRSISAGTLPDTQTTLMPKSAISKVNTICDALLKALQSRKTSHLQNIITSHVCKVPPALDDGLSLVAELMQEDEKLAEKAVEHICFLVDVNRLYEHALGLYNLDLALLVAQQSQRDPREYLPFIQNLHALPDLRRKFEIDDHLTRRAKALTHLQAMSAFDELCQYTSKHTLYQDALQLYRYDQPCLQALTNLYAAHLESTSAYREAGVAYESLQSYAKATSCYRAAGASCWQECLFAAQQQSPSLSPSTMADLATDLANALWEAKDYAGAATIHLEYLDALEMAIRCLCKGSLFAEATRLVVRLGRSDLLPSAVDTGITDALGSTTEFLADCKAQLRAQVPRITELRQRAAQDPLSFYEGERTGGADIPDDVSVAASSNARLSTNASLFTRYTGSAGSGTIGTGVSRATSRNRRREEKKRARGRKGTVYEEEYLVNSVRRLVQRVDEARPEVERLVMALVRRGMAERARAAETLMVEVMDVCAEAIGQVFPSTEVEGREGEERAWRATGGDAVLQDWVEGRGKMVEAPVLGKMQRLTLLGS